MAINTPIIIPEVPSPGEFSATQMVLDARAHPLGKDFSPIGILVINKAITELRNGHVLEFVAKKLPSSQEEAESEIESSVQPCKRILGVFHQCNFQGYQVHPIILEPKIVEKFHILEKHIIEQFDEDVLGCKCGYQSVIPEAESVIFG